MDGSARSYTRPGEVWTLSSEEVVTQVQTDIAAGLSEEEVARRYRIHGPNILKSHKKRGVWSILFEQFRSIIIGLLAVATLAAFWFGEWVEGWAILVVILINALIGFFTELRAVRSMEALFKLGRVKTRVRRNGRVIEIDAEDLVPGDIVVVEGGDIITADLRIVESSKLQVDESTLTGESMPVDKQVDLLPGETILAERSNMLYKGTSVTRGSGEGVVTATGLDTELGHISSLAERAEDTQTPLEDRLDKLGNRLIILTLAISLFVALSGIITGKELFLMIETGIALAVAAIPEGLPIVATLALAKGLRIMARKNALINRLSAVETLGATGIICTDKTGTLTENQMTVIRVLLSGREVQLNGDLTNANSGSGKLLDIEQDEQLRLALEAAVLCNNASLSDEGYSVSGDPLEIALLAAGRKAGLELKELRRKYPEEKEDAFDPDLKMMATWNRRPSGRYRVHVKGAPGAVIEASESIFEDGEVKPFTEQKKEEWLEKNRRLGNEGLRIIAVAFKESEDTGDDTYNKLVFIGLIPLLDPPRKDVREALRRCRQAGIRVVMVTGDQMATAKYIAGAVGMDEGEELRAYHGKDLPVATDLEAMAEKKDLLLRANVFARINPQQKLDLIGLYQNNGNIVAMTGDGVNDAPALKKADIGIAMGKRGTQVARESADMVLTDDAFSTIVAAIEHGRVIFGNIRRFIYYLMSCNLSEVLVVGMASLIGAPLPVLPLQILFLNLVTDVFPALALGVGEGEEGVMELPPREPEEPILNNDHWKGIALYSSIITVTVLGVLWIGLDILHLEVTAAVTLSFLTLALSQLWHVFNMRSSRSDLIKNSITGNRWIWGALGLCMAIILTAVYFQPVAAVLEVHPPTMRGWVVIIGFSLIPLVVGQSGKAVMGKVRN